MKKHYIKALCILLVVFVLTSCGANNATSSQISSVSAQNNSQITAAVNGGQSLIQNSSSDNSQMISSQSSDSEDPSLFIDRPGNNEPQGYYKTDGENNVYYIMAINNRYYDEITNAYYMYTGCNIINAKDEEGNILKFAQVMLTIKNNQSAILPYRPEFWYPNRRDINSNYQSTRLFSIPKNQMRTVVAYIYLSNINYDPERKCYYCAYPMCEFKNVTTYIRLDIAA